MANNIGKMKRLYRVIRKLRGRSAQLQNARNHRLKLRRHGDARRRLQKASRRANRGQ